MTTFTKATMRDAHLTSYLGVVNTTYARLVERFGKPHITGGDKTNSEWIIRFADGQVATIYNYKTGMTPTEEYDWHIGGNNRVVVNRIRQLVNG
jgi:hypothetical protein